MQFTRSSGKRFYKRLFLVGVEGTRTECDYFSMFNSAYVHVVPVTSREGNSPKKVLSTLKAAIPRYQLRDGDYLWVVVDRDEWPEEEIELCRMWAQDAKESPGLCKGLCALRGYSQGGCGRTGQNDVRIIGRRYG
jgi:hypothetical protein